MIVTECRLITNDDASPCIDDVEKLGIKLTGLQPLNRVGVVVSPVKLPTGTVAPGVEDLYTAAAFRNTTCMADGDPTAETYSTLHTPADAASGVVDSVSATDWTALEGTKVYMGGKTCAAFLYSKRMYTGSLRESMLNCTDVSGVCERI
jgi:hypothetical protein